MVLHESSSGIETIITECFHLRFRWHEDRWKHEIVAAARAESLPRVDAIEMAADLEEHDRVVSPAYQQIHVEEDKARGVVRAFLVGQSGPHHFSAAFEVADRPDGAVVDVDVADRCRAPVAYLAATYRVEASPGTWAEETPPRADPAAGPALVLTCEHPHARLIFEADHPGRHAAEEAGHGAVRVQALAHADPAARTHRFRYRWRWAVAPRPDVRDRHV